MIDPPDMMRLERRVHDLEDQVSLLNRRARWRRLFRFAYIAAIIFWAFHLAGNQLHDQGIAAPWEQLGQILSNH
jgi:hypothetical protein